jgi:redox-sensitive bicupin YhaK (pirin superfamily)
MLMKAGNSFFHEEQVLEGGGTLEALQIFIRPKEKDSKPEVTFYNLEEKYSENEWRLIASPTNSTPLQFSSDTWLYDIKVTTNNNFRLPELPTVNSSCLLYIFDGEVTINDVTNLSKGESLLVQNEPITFSAKQGAELVLFITKDDAIYYDKGMYSGNQS